MSAPREDGPDAANDQPVKTLKKHIIDFIARCDMLAGKHPWIFFLILVAALETTLMVWGTLQ
jgi:hypothetical protein